MEGMADKTDAVTDKSFEKRVEQSAVKTAIVPAHSRQAGARPEPKIAYINVFCGVQVARKTVRPPPLSPFPKGDQ
jgi:hypothetical protein